MMHTLRLPFSMRGFTLLELMVVIAIISILATLSTPSFIRYVAKAKLLEAQNIATQHQSIIEEFILINGKFPSGADFNLIKASLADNSIVSSINVENENDSTGDLKLILSESTGVTEGQYFIYSRDENRNWTCTSDLNDNLLPPLCQAGESP
ncbi:pilin [Marinomonas sp. C2222]|uniref:Pilin n=1 Tax=Marinomonas sargassi TaxID=2984494 RepID=A0ABT2YT02_9GAMM|nr:pilin [Marinomonas sargassi]MCV2402890.1 pilin [Marinomonas sargassi]